MAPTYDSLLATRVGALGPWQLAVFAVVGFCTTAPLLPFQQLALTVPPHFCAQPRLEEAGWSRDAIRNRTVPPKSGGGFEECVQFNLSLQDSNWTDVAENASVIPCQHGWSYDDAADAFHGSLPREFDLVCQKQFQASFARSAYLLGMIPGPALAGFCADRFGRRPMGILISAVTAAVAVATAFLPRSVLAFCVLRFLTGFTASAVNVIGYIWCAEFTTLRNQNVFNLLFGMASKQLPEASYIALAFWLREWRLLHAVCAAPHVLALCFPLFAPESPRWLLAVGKKRAGAAAMMRIAAYNRRSREDRAAILAAVTEGAFVVDACRRGERETASWKLLFTNKVFRLRLGLLLYSWIAMNISLYGLNYFSVRLEGNPFVIATVLSAFGTVFLAAKTIILMWFERKKALVSCYVLITALTTACAVTLHAFPGHVINIVLATVAYGVTFCLFNMLYTIVPGLFPTATQNFAMGICFGFSRIGAAFATFIEKLDSVTGMKWLPMAVLSVVLAANVLVILALPIQNTEQPTAEEDRRASDSDSEKSKLKETDV